MNWKNLLKTMFGLALLALLFAQASPIEVWNRLRNLPLVWLLPAGAAFLPIYLFRTWRFRQLLATPVRFWELFRVVAIQSLANVILPARLGELSYLYFLKRKEVPLAESLASLLLARVFDLAALSGLFFLFLFISDAIPPGADYLVDVVLIFYALLVVVFLAAVLLKEWFWRGMEKLLVRIPLLNRRIDYLRQAFYTFVAAFSSLADWRRLLVLFALSLGVWGSAQAFGYLCLVKLLHLPLTLPETVMVFSFMQLVGLLPIHPFGGIGTVDALWAYAVISFGVGREAAISAALTAHVLTYVFCLLLGLTACGPLFAMRGELFPRRDKSLSEHRSL